VFDVLFADAKLALNNLTVANGKGTGGGGVANQGTLTVTNSTLSGNSVTDLDYGRGGGIASSGGSATLKNTIVANSPPGGNCYGTYINGGYNLDSDGSCGFGAANNSLSDKDPMLGLLADNGGPTKTRALLAGSPAIDKGDSFGAATDQRGVARPQGAASDIGAFEVESTIAPDTVKPSGTVLINNGATHTNSTAVTLKLSATDPAPASGVASMRFRNGNTTTWSSWFDYSTSKSWTLSAGAGTKTVYAQFRDVAGNISAEVQDAIVLDTVKPRVSAATPTGTGIGRGTNVVATFSERMGPASVTNSTLKLFKVTSSGTTQVTNVTVTPSSDGLKATLNPFGASTTLLAARTRYMVVTTGAKDLAGNALDQNSTTAGNQ
jgi:hypothetical protein